GPRDGDGAELPAPGHARGARHGQRGARVSRGLHGEPQLDLQQRGLRGERVRGARQGGGVDLPRGADGAQARERDRGQPLGRFLVAGGPHPTLRRGWRWLESLALSLASLAVCAALLEAGARLWVDLQARRQEHVMDPPISRYDPRLGWFHVAGAERRVSRSEFDVRLKFNKHGLRGPDRDYAPPPGVRRTLILGASFAEGYYVDEGQTVAAVLEGLLRRCGPHEVINAGVQGYSTDQEYLFYLHDGRRYGSRLVLLLFYSNDLRYNTSPVGSGGEAKPYFEVDDRGALVRRNDPVPPPDPSRPSRAPPGAHGPVPWRG